MTNTTLEKREMGRVLVNARIENLADLWAAESGALPSDQVRAIEVDDALVDTGCTLLGLSSRTIKELGLTPLQTRNMRTATGTREVNLYNAVRLTIQDRFCNIDVMEMPDDGPVLIGQLPLEHLDFVIDARQHKLIGNPAHGGEHMYELY